MASNTTEARVLQRLKTIVFVGPGDFISSGGGGDILRFMDEANLELRATLSRWWVFPLDPGLSPEAVIIAGVWETCRATILVLENIERNLSDNDSKKIDDLKKECRDKKTEWKEKPEAAFPDGIPQPKSSASKFYGYTGKDQVDKLAVFKGGSDGIIQRTGFNTIFHDSDSETPGEIPDKFDDNDIY